MVVIQRQCALYYSIQVKKERKIEKSYSQDGLIRCTTTLEISNGRMCVRCQIVMQIACFLANTDSKSVIVIILL